MAFKYDFDNLRLFCEEGAAKNMRTLSFRPGKSDPAQMDMHTLNVGYHHNIYAFKLSCVIVPHNA